MAPPLKILLVEDNPGDARLVREMISGATIASFQLEWMNRLEDALKRVREDHFDAILLDLELPDSIGLETVASMRDAAPGMPIIVMTSLDDEKLAAAAVHNGAQDYMVKGHQDPDLFSRSLYYAVERSRGQMALQEAYASLEKSEERFRSITASATDAIISADESGNIVTWNNSAESMFGYSAGEALGQPVTMLMPESFRDPHMSGMENFLATGNAKVMGRAVELTAMRKDGTEFPVELSLSSWNTAEGTFFGSVIRDVTEKTRIRRFNEALNSIMMAISSTTEIDEISKDVLKEAAAALEADSSVLVGLSEGKLIVKYALGNPVEVKSGEAVSSTNAPLAEKILETGSAMTVGDMLVDTNFDPRVLKRLDVRSAIGAPLVMRDKLIGAIVFRFKESKEFTPADIDFVEKLAAAISLGMENAELFRNEKESRASIQGYAVQLSILHEIGISLNRETSIPRLHDIIVRSATSLTSSGVCFMTISADGEAALGPVSYAPWMTSDRPAIDEDVASLHEHLAEMISDKDRYAFRITDPSQLSWFPERYAGLGDLLVGVIRDTRGRIRALFVMGARFESGPFSRSDEDIISLLAAQGSVAMTSAESFEKEHDIAETLQTALLPEIPVRQDMEIGLLYRSASRAGRIGGDFYDFGELGPNVVSFAIGDVCGKGLSAASHTAMVKFMLRAYLEEGRSPGECLTLLNDSLCKNLEPDKFITLVLAVIDVAAGKIRYSLAGHPLPIISRDGEVVELEVPQTIPLGVIPGYIYLQHG